MIRAAATSVSLLVMLAPGTIEAQLVPLTAGRSVESAAARAPADPQRVPDPLPKPDCSSRPDWRRHSLRVGNVTSTLKQAQAYFNASGSEVVKGVSVTASEQATSVYSELLSDFLRIGGPFGYARFGFGATIVSAKDDSTDTTPDAVSAEENKNTGFDRLIGSGGNAVLFMALPLLHYESRSGGCSNSRFDVLILPRLAADVPSVDGATNVKTGVADLAAEAQWVAVSVGSFLRFYGTARAGWIRGSSDYYTQLGLPETSRGFRYMRWEVGVDISGKLRLSAARLGGGPPSLVRQPAIAQVQLLR